MDIALAQKCHKVNLTVMLTVTTLLISVVNKLSQVSSVTFQDLILTVGCFVDLLHQVDRGLAHLCTTCTVCSGVTSPQSEAGANITKLHMSPCSQSLCICADGAALGGETYYCKIVRISQYLVNLLLPNLLQKLHG